jgi:Malectin domain
MYVFIYTDAESGRRVFNALVNGRTLAPDLDIFQVVGTRTAYTVEATIQVNDAFEIALEFDNLIDNPKISGFEIYDVTGSFVPSTLINSGGPEYIDAQQRVWMADAYFAGGTAVTTVTTFGIAGTDDDTLYHSERNGIFSYVIPVPSGNPYNVTLYFAELVWGEIGQRAFDVFVQGSLRTTDVDIIALAGSNLTAYELSFPDVLATDGLVTLNFTLATPTAADVPKLSAIAVTLQQP